MLSRNAQASPRTGARRTLRTGGLLLTFAALAATSPAYALDAGDTRQSLFQASATAPQGVAEGLEAPIPSPLRTLVYGDHGVGLSTLANASLPVTLTGGVLPASAGELVVMEGNLYLVERTVGVVRVPWNPLLNLGAGGWDADASSVIPGTDTPQWIADRVVAISSDGAGNLFAGFIRSGRIAKIADPLGDAAITEDWAQTSTGVGVASMVFDDAARTLYIAQADGLSRLTVPDPTGASAGAAEGIPGVDILPAGGLALDQAGATWAGTKNLLVGTAEGVEQVNLTSAGPLRRVYANGLLNVTGLHLLESSLTSGGADFAAGTLLAGEDPSLGADGANGQWVAVTVDDGAVPAPAPPAFPAVDITSPELTTPADLAWSGKDELFVTDHLAGPSQIDFTTSPPSLKPLFDNGIPPAEPGAPPMPFDSAGAIAFDHFGNAYVTDNAFGPAGTAGLFKIPADPQTKALKPHETTMIASFIDPARGRSMQPDSLAVDNDGNLYVGFGRSSEIYRVTDLQSPHPVAELFTTTRSGQPALGLEVDPENRLLVSEGLTITRFLLNDGIWEGSLTDDPADDTWIDLPVGVPGQPTLGAPSDLALAPGNLYVLDDLKVVQIGLQNDANRTPIAGAATVRLKDLVIPGGLVLDEEGRVRPAIDLGGAPGPEIPATNDPDTPFTTLFAGTDFAVQGTGVIRASSPIPVQRGYHSPSDGGVAMVSVTNATQTYDAAYWPTLDPRAIVSDPSHANRLTFEVLPAEGGAAAVTQTFDNPAWSAANAFTGTGIDVSTLADGDYVLRATVANVQDLGLPTESVLGTRHFDRPITIDNDYPAAGAFTRRNDLGLFEIIPDAEQAFAARIGAAFTVDDFDFRQVDRVQFTLTPNDGSAPVVVTDTAAPFRVQRNFGPAADSVTVSATIRLSRATAGGTQLVTIPVPARTFLIDDQAPVVPALAIAGAGVHTDLVPGVPVIQGPVTVSSTIDDVGIAGLPAAPVEVQARAGLTTVTLPGLTTAGSAPVSFSAPWDSTDTLVLGGDGNRRLVAVGRDRAGNTTTVGQDVIVDNVAPDVAITTPVGQIVSVSATNAGLPITQVTLTSGGLPIPGVPADTTAPYGFVLPPGTWSDIQATATTALTSATSGAVGPVVVGNGGGGPGLAAAGGAAGLRPLTVTGLRVAGAPAAGAVGPVSVSFSLNRPATVSFVVSTKAGKVVRALKKAARKGKVTLVWNGRDAKGHRVKAGLYRIQVIAVDAAGHRKVVTRTIRVR